MFKIGGQKIPFITVLIIVTEGVLITAVLCFAAEIRLHPDTISVLFANRIMLVRSCPGSSHLHTVPLLLRPV